MRRSILLVALLVLMSFPSVEAFAATETIVQKGAKLGNPTTDQGVMALGQALHLMQANAIEVQVDGDGSKKLIEKTGKYDDRKEKDPYLGGEIDDDYQEKGH